MKLTQILKSICDVFKHDCWDNKETISASYIKDGDSGVIFAIGKEYRCKKCGSKIV